MLAIGLAVVNLIPVASLYLGGAKAPGTDARVYRAVLVNADFRNASPEKVVAFVAGADADFVVFVEFTPALEELLEPLRPKYPFSRSAPQTSGRGIALWSRLPCTDFEVRNLDASRFLSVMCRMTISGKSLTVVGTHAPWPMGTALSQSRSDHFTGLARLAQEQDGPVMILGDLNCTSGSPHFQDLLAQGGLNDSRRGFGVQPSWPTWLPWFGIAIDHCLVTPGVTIHDRWIGPDVGSDHYPVVIEFSL
jgi:endonuclease/exonuclease/phosphatase (EEP) superfamily protein YafD